MNCYKMIARDASVRAPVLRLPSHAAYLSAAVLALLYMSRLTAAKSLPKLLQATRLWLLLNWLLLLRRWTHGWCTLAHTILVAGSREIGCRVLKLRLCRRRRCHHFSQLVRAAAPLVGLLLSAAVARAEPSVARLAHARLGRGWGRGLRGV